MTTVVAHRGLTILLSIALFLSLHAVAFAQGNGPSDDSWSSPPDEIFQPDSAYIVAAKSGDSDHEFEIPSSQAADRWIRGLDFHPGDSRVVQSVSIYVKKTGQWLGGWVPGQNQTTMFPDSVAAQLPAGSSIVMEVHYRAVSEDVTDRSELGLFFATAKPLRPLSGVGIESQVLAPADETPIQIRREFTIISDSYAIALRPEMHAAGRSLQITAVDPSGQSTVLLKEPEYQEDSKIPYMLDQPLLLPKGTRIIAVASYQNLTAVPVEDVFGLSVALYPSSVVHLAADPKAPVKRAVKKAPAKRAPAKKKPVPRKSSGR